jgi:hypothetical protein
MRLRPVYEQDPRLGDVLGRPEDQVGTPDTEIVKVGLELGDIVARIIWLRRYPQARGSEEPSFSQRLLWSDGPIGVQGALLVERW